MKSWKTLVPLILLGLTAAGSAQADRGHYHGHSRVGVGVVIGAPFYGPYWGPAYYPPPIYYPPAYPPVIVERQVAPPVYVEQAQQAAPAPAAAADAPENYWYYCADTKTYYPYVKECASPWQKVTPQAPAPR